jgi:hypothetical protein
VIFSIHDYHEAIYDFASKGNNVANVGDQLRHYLKVSIDARAKERTKADESKQSHGGNWKKTMR